MVNSTSVYGKLKLNYFFSSNFLNLIFLFNFKIKLKFNIFFRLFGYIYINFQIECNFLRNLLYMQQLEKYKRQQKIKNKLLLFVPNSINKFNN